MPFKTPDAQASAPLDQSASPEAAQPAQHTHTSRGVKGEDIPVDRKTTGKHRHEARTQDRAVSGQGSPTTPVEASAVPEEGAAAFDPPADDLKLELPKEER